MKTKRFLAVVGLCLTTFALIGQLMLMLNTRQVTLIESLIRFFSYFTITTNILVALFFSSECRTAKRGGLDFLQIDGAPTAITAFILIVGVVYQTVLRGLWSPDGMQLLVDQMLHAAVPLYMLFYWLFTLRSQKLTLKPLFSWLAYPLIYLVFALSRGYVSGFYPYPFLHLERIGVGQTALNILLISLGTVLMLTLLFLLGRSLQKIKRI